LTADLILLVAVAAIGLVLSVVVVRWDARRLNQRRTAALRSFYERE
jgi:uncharacterized membrane protein YqjE